MGVRLFKLKTKMRPFKNFSSFSFNKTVNLKLNATLQKPKTKAS